MSPTKNWWDESCDWSAAIDGYRLFRMEKVRKEAMPSTSRNGQSVKTCV